MAQRPIDLVFKIDLRFWIVALKLMSAKQFLIFLIYLVPFTAFFVVALHVLHRNFSTMGAGRGALYLTTPSCWKALQYALADRKAVQPAGPRHPRFRTVLLHHRRYPVLRCSAIAAFRHHAICSSPGGAPASPVWAGRSIQACSGLRADDRACWRRRRRRRSRPKRWAEPCIAPCFRRTVSADEAPMQSPRPETRYPCV